MKALTIVLLLIATPAFAAHGDRIQIGDNIAVTDPVVGDLIAVGGDVDVNAEVSGDVVVFGGSVQIAAPAKQDVYVAGGEIAIGGDVGNDVRVAGGEVKVGKTAHVAGDISIAGGEVTIAGDVLGKVEVAGGQVTIDGHVGGDVEATGGNVSLGPDARIDGRLTYSSKHELRSDAAAQVSGGITRDPWRDEYSPLHWHGVSGMWSFGYVLLALLVLAIAPGYAARVTDTLHDDFVQSLLFGLIALVVTPMLMLLLAVTIIGIPAALLLLLTYLVFLLAGRLFAAIALGDIVLQRMRGGTLRPTDRGARMLAAVIAVIAIGVAAWLPIVGHLAGTVVTLLGLGAMLLQLRKRRTVAAS